MKLSLPEIQSRKRTLDNKNLKQLMELPFCLVHRNTLRRIYSPHIDSRPAREQVGKETK